MPVPTPSVWLLEHVVLGESLLVGQKGLPGFLLGRRLSGALGLFPTNQKCHSPLIQKVYLEQTRCAGGNLLFER